MLDKRTWENLGVMKTVIFDSRDHHALHHIFIMVLLSLRSISSQQLRVVEAHVLYHFW